MAEPNPKSEQSECAVSAFPSPCYLFKYNEICEDFFTCMPDVINCNLCQHTPY